jgi:hypothetical protein
MNNALHIKENNKHDLHFWPHLARFILPRGISRLPLRRLTFRLRVIPVDPRLVARKVVIWLLPATCLLPQTSAIPSAARTITRRRYTTLFDRSSQRTERCAGTIFSPRERGSSRIPPCKQGYPEVYPQPSKKKSVSELFDHTLYTMCQQVSDVSIYPRRSYDSSVTGGEGENGRS